jgi:3-oxoacyl-[acyl-carrier protein] reductase
MSPSTAAPASKTRSRAAADVAASGRRAFVSQADVSRAPAVAAMIAEINHALGPIDILINNAGIALRRGIDDLTEADFD